MLAASQDTQLSRETDECFRRCHINLQLLIYLIDHGLAIQYQLVSIVIAILIFVSYLFFLNHGQFANLNYGFLTLPIIATLVFNFAGLLSWKISDREFRATWRGARYFYTEKKNWIDYLLSFVVIMTEFSWPILIAIILKGKA
jgi:hypothetical protein